MTVESTSTFAGPYYTNGSATAFPFSFKALTVGEVSVEIDRVVVNPSLYTVELGAQSGTVVFHTAPVLGRTLFVVASPSFRQGISFSNQAPFLPTSHNEANDRSALRDQVLAGGIARSLKVPLGEVIAPLPPVGERLGGNKVIGPHPDTGAIQIIDAVVLKGDKGDPGVDAPAADTAKNTRDITVTRDPFVRLVGKIQRGAFGNITYTNGVRSIVPPTLIVASIGNSHMLGQGSAIGTPGELLRAALQAQLPGWTVVHDNYAVTGSWCNQMPSHISAFTRKPDIVLVGDPMNDGTGNIFMGYEGFQGPDNAYGGYEAALEDVFNRLAALEITAINLSGHQPHPTRAKANGRLSVTPEVLMTWPQASLIAFYVRIVFTAANQRISAYAVDAQGGFVPWDLFVRYSGGVFGVGQYLIEFDPSTGSTGTMHQVLEVAADGTWVRVDGTITADKNDGVTSVRQGNFDNETQVMPPFSQAIVQRDYSGTGALVDVSWRHWELAKANRRTAARNGVITVDSDAIFGRAILQSSDYDTAYVQPVGDDYHSAFFYTTLVEPFEALARDIVNGTIPAGRIYS
jgi:hypothetical protein